MSPSCALGTWGEGSRGAFCLAAAPGAAPEWHQQPLGGCLRGPEWSWEQRAKLSNFFFTTVRSSDAIEGHQAAT